MENNKELTDQEVVERMHEHLLALEEQADVSVLSLHWFEQKVREEKRSLKQRLRKELLTFIVVAVIIVVVAITLYVQVPLLFVVVQLAALFMFIPVIWLLDRNRRDRAVGTSTESGMDTGTDMSTGTRRNGKQVDRE